MKTIVPSYYRAFSCIANKCRHSCCIGWEIAVDRRTAARYAAMDGALGDRLREALTRDDNGDAYIQLTESGRCPLLASDGLCDIIREKGDGALCQICADHPRFRAFYTDRTEMGLGACCEAAASLILAQTAPTAFITLSDDGGAEAPTAAEQAFFRERDQLLRIATDRTQSLSAREEALLRTVEIERPPLSDAALFAIFSPLERLDPAWDAVLSRLYAPAAVGESVLQIPLEQLLVYFLWRHLPDSRFDDRLAARVAFAVHSVRLLRRLLTDTTHAALVELTRAYCAEIEYSEDNLDTLLDTFDITPRF